MSRDGISGAIVDDALPYATNTNAECVIQNFFPCVAYAIFWNESIRGECNGSWNAATVVSSDGGHGIGQLTSSYPDDWENPASNIAYAVGHFMVPAYNEWVGELQGDDLVRAIAATYNAGYGNAKAGHDKGNLDLYTTDDYASRILETYKQLVLEEHPT